MFVLFTYEKRRHDVISPRCVILRQLHTFCGANREVLKLINFCVNNYQQ